MAEDEQHRAALQELNRNYVRSVDEADVAWFDLNLAPDFFNTNPDGSFIDRKDFLAQIGRGSSVKNIREHDVIIRILGGFAIIHARTSYQKADGTQGAGRYTDDWQLRDGRWKCVRPTLRAYSQKAAWRPPANTPCIVTAGIFLAPL
jgi:Domain of unknown function (DUF4440)